MDEIKARIATIQETMNQYKAYRSELENMLVNINSGIDYLKQSYEESPRKSFFEICYPQLSDIVNEHIKFICFFESELETWCEKLRTLSDELERHIA